jgi:hypothetical protein
MMDSKRVVLALAYICIFLSTVAYAQGQAPEEVAKASMELVRKGDWSAYARLMHPEALAEAKRLFRPIIAADTSGKVGELFFGVKNSTQYDALSEIAAFEALMTNLTKNIPAFTEALKTVDFTIVGSLPEGEEFVHVVYRGGAKAEGVAISKTSVVTLRRH